MTGVRVLLRAIRDAITDNAYDYEGDGGAEAFHLSVIMLMVTLNFLKKKTMVPGSSK